ncbi:uncharacterized protein POS17_2128 [Pseudomonas sp. Os17]|nr:uncharacterized protein POS17_2128 [Pseudomonas sp. Os17]BAQ80108.1 uncharacterized protein PST29_2219 [Pseudomonas sp. St29]
MPNGDPTTDLISPTCNRSPVGAGLPAKLANDDAQAPSYRVQLGAAGLHIRCCGCGGWRFRSYSDSLLKSAKVSKTLLPPHPAPRLGSAFPRSGIAPGARRHRPSMAWGG